MVHKITEWNVPNRVLFGRGAAEEVGSYVEQFDAERAFIVTDEGVHKAGVLDPVLESIEAAEKDYIVYDGVQSDPTDTVIHEAAKSFSDANGDLFIGIGGGSVIDTAKAASILTTNDGHILDFVGTENISNESPPSIYIPTTSGTGSEVGHWTIVKNSDTNVKEEIGDVKLLADLSLIDPELTVSAPKSIKSATGMDVLTHAVEAYLSINAQSQTSALALDSIEKVNDYLPRAVEYRGEDWEAVSKMARASMQAGMAFNGAGLGAVHAISHQVGGMFGVPHGLANAIILPYVMEYNLSQVPKLMTNIAKALGEDVKSAKPTRVEAYKAIRATRQLAESIRIPPTLEETTAERDAIPELAEQALEDGSLTGNPRTIGQEDIETILDNAFNNNLVYKDHL